MDDSTIDLLPGASLDATVNGGAAIHDAVIGETGTWQDPRRIAFSSSSDEGHAQEWRIGGRSIITGCLDDRSIDVILEDDTVVQGRIAANSITMNDSTCLLYDHGMSEGLGQPRAASYLSRLKSRMGRFQGIFESLPDDFVDDLMELDEQNTRFMRRNRERQRMNNRRARARN